MKVEVTVCSNITKCGMGVFFSLAIIQSLLPGYSSIR